MLFRSFCSTVMIESTGFNAYCLYTALKLHFTGSYDFFKYNGKTAVTQETFLKRKDKYSFYKLSRKYNMEELQKFYIANFVYGSSTWVGEMLGPEGDEAYKKWSKINQSLTYRFENDIVGLLSCVDSPDEIIKVHNGQYPRLLLEVMQGVSTVETMVILNDIMGFFPMWTKKISDDVIWPNWKMKSEKYAPFLHYDKPKFKEILKEQLNEIH